jgi:hypothetical protein
MSLQNSLISRMRLYFPCCSLFLHLHNKLNQDANTSRSSWCIIPLMFSHLEPKLAFQSIGDKSIVNAKFTLFHQVEVNARVLWPRKLLSHFREPIEQSPCGQGILQVSLVYLSARKLYPTRFYVINLTVRFSIL